MRTSPSLSTAPIFTILKAAYSLLQQPSKRAGFASACQAFGHRELLGILRSAGLVMEPILTVHT